MGRSMYLGSRCEETMMDATQALVRGPSQARQLSRPRALARMRQRGESSNTKDT